MKTIIYFLLGSLILFSCSEPEKETIQIDELIIEKDTAEIVVEPVSSYPEDIKYSDVAQYIAGYNGREDGPFTSIENTSLFKKYQASIDQLWKKTNAKLPTIKEWSATEMAEVNTDGGTLFYPFSGADFLHADLFFPSHDNIVLIALEPIGTFPDLNKKDTLLEPYMNGLKKSMHAILGLSFFRTIAMADDFQSEMDGTLHVLMHFMARTGHTVLFQEKVAILPEGELTTDLSSISDSTYVGNRYYFRKNGEEKVKTLCYFAVNMQNVPYVSRGGLVAKGLASRTDLVAYFNGLNIKSTYLKSASYLMHRPTFSIIRNIILDESEFLLQDDSGIPVQFFDTKKWALTFYGNFVHPISLFEERQQEDLAEIYMNKKNVKPLPFGIGYQYVNGTSNLMKAVKK